MDVVNLVDERVAVEDPGTTSLVRVNGRAGYSGLFQSDAAN